MMEDTMVYNATIFHSGDYVSFIYNNIKYDGQIYIGNKEELKNITDDSNFSKIIWLLSNNINYGDPKYIPLFTLGYKKWCITALRNSGSLSDGIYSLELLKSKNIFDEIMRKAFIIKS